jgi:hypothetical protein
MLKDSRVKVNELDNVGWTPLWYAARCGYLDIIKTWIASGREMDLGTRGDEKTDAIGGAKGRGHVEVVTLLERFKENPLETRHGVRVKLGLLGELAAEMFALVIFASDGLLQINDTSNPSPAAIFFSISTQFPMEIQMALCCRVVGSAKDTIPGEQREMAFKDLAMKL